MTASLRFMRAILCHTAAESSSGAVAAVAPDNTVGFWCVRKDYSVGVDFLLRDAAEHPVCFVNSLECHLLVCQ